MPDIEQAAQAAETRDLDSTPYPALIDERAKANQLLTANRVQRNKLTHRKVIAAWDAYVEAENAEATALIDAINANLVARGIRR